MVEVLLQTFSTINLLFTDDVEEIFNFVMLHINWWKIKKNNFRLWFKNIILNFVRHVPVYLFML